MQKKIWGLIVLQWIVFLMGNATPLTGKEEIPGGSLRGLVVDVSTGLPLPEATISLPDLKIDVVAGRDGAYAVRSLPNGRFVITVSYVGYRSFVGAVVINGATIQDFRLAVAVVENEAVVVTGVSSSTQLKHAPTHISVLSQKELQQSSGTGLLDAVAKVPGVSIITTGPAIAKPSIRGLGYNRVVTLNDGVRQEGQQWGDEHGVELDEYSAQKIEVLRGPASLMYGSDAIGGVLNILTNIPVPENTIRGRLSGSLNSNNNMQGGYANIAGNVHGFNWNAYGSLKSAGDYKNRYDGDVLNSRFNEKNFGGYLGLNRSWGYSHLILSSFDQHVGMVEGERDAEGRLVLEGYEPGDQLLTGKTPLIPNQRVQHFKAALDNGVSLDNGGRITFLAGFQRNQRREFGDVEAPSVPEAYFDLKTINYSAAYHLPQINGWKTSLGLNGMSQQNRNGAEEALIPDYRLSDMGIYGYASKTFSNTTLSGGLRFDNRSISGKQTFEEGTEKFQPFTKKLSSFSGSVGLAHDFNANITLKANASKGFRAPNMAELAANGVHEGTFRYEIGNADLKSEDAYAFDLGLDVNTQHVSLNVSPYINHINNYIYYQKLLTGSGNDSLIGDVAAYRFTQQSANLLGVEATLDIHPHPLDWLHFENAFSWTKGTFTKAVDGSDNLPLIAPLRLLTVLRAEFPTQLKAFRNFYAKVEMDNVAAQQHFFSGYNTETATSGYTLFNAGLGSDIYLGGVKRAAVILAVSNIGDVAYQQHLSRLKYAPENPVTGRAGVFNMGRNFTAKLILPFSWNVK
ncbi:TonB-dependent receptor [Niabella drilacis]|uniref:Iron complex outermembrane recepter protein n=1 Tax=Niabella drilacis (strain DSM 25811 / CCM 8410 / CCUG 62505 / LMG 26954 / E90) TaxID=1285928 RepID=A0A1G6V2V3_NIADE|nr:TonB-dependent receptor [Niabella drilacis]SDD47852.1 iron complex outermembrane recepter protein [Niabella drilacis]